MENNSSLHSFFLANDYGFGKYFISFSSIGKENQANISHWFDRHRTKTSKQVSKIKGKRLKGYLFENFNFAGLELSFLGRKKSNNAIQYFF